MFIPLNIEDQRSEFNWEAMNWASSMPPHKIKQTTYDSEADQHSKLNQFGRSATCIPAFQPQLLRLRVARRPTNNIQKTTSKKQLTTNNSQHATNMAKPHKKDLPSS